MNQPIIRPPKAASSALLRTSVPVRPWQLEPSPFVLPAALAPVRPTRREFLIGAGSLLVLGAAGCGGDVEGGDEGASGATRTIEHKYGSTEVPASPQRVVTVGFTDQDPVLALGVEPVGVHEWFGEYPYATWPWAQDELGDATPEVLPAGENLDFEKIATLEPDLILGVFSGMTEQEYETLSQVAPTVAQSGEYVDYGVPWQEQTRVIGRALGREERAEELVAELEARFAEAREEHPEFEGASGVVELIGGAAGDYHVYGPQDLRGRFMSALGFDIPDDIVELVGDSFFAPISRERLDLFDADVLVWIVDSPTLSEELEDDALYQNLEVAKEGRDIFLDVNAPLAGALSFSTVLSLPFALDEMVPRLAAAIDGDPETEPAPVPETEATS